MGDDIVTRLRCIYVDDEAADAVQALQAENGRLRRWKTEAMEVISRWDAIADSVPCELGQRRSDAVAAEIKRLRAELSKTRLDHLTTIGELMEATKEDRRG